MGGRGGRMDVAWRGCGAGGVDSAGGQCQEFVRKRYTSPAGTEREMDGNAVRRGKQKGRPGKSPYGYAVWNVSGSRREGRP